MRRRALLSGNGGDIDYSKVYFTMVVTTGGNITWAGSTTANTLSYSKDDGETWTTADSTTIISVVKGDNVLWKGTPTPTSSGIGTFSSSGNFTVEGNAMSLLYGDNFSGQTSLSGKDYTFKNLFRGSTGVTSAANMVLPATTLAEGCYNQMFQKCTNLTTVPSDLLPATTLADKCYNSMFQKCTNLTTVPELPATTLASVCYNSMFHGCTNLTAAPELPATTLTLNCYRYMFYSCTSLITAPSLPATTLVDGCYNSMFQGCTSLNSIKCLTTDISEYNEYNCTYNWVKGVAASGTFTKAASMTGWTTGINGIPSGWNVVDA